jgi:anti-sigma regulatory factor (Ser/Thr protein kinase)
VTVTPRLAQTPPSRGPFVDPISGAPLSSTDEPQIDGFHFDLRRDTREVARARRVTAEFLRESPDEVVTVAQLLTSELVSNAVEHGSGSIRLSIRCHDDVLRIGVTDDSPRPLAFTRPRTSDDRGRGLLLVERMALAWGVTSTPGAGKTVWFKLRTA